jgi:hypothetical protein
VKSSPIDNGENSGEAERDAILYRKLGIYKYPGRGGGGKFELAETLLHRLPPASLI